MFMATGCLLKLRSSDAISSSTMDSDVLTVCSYLSPLPLLPVDCSISFTLSLSHSRPLARCSYIPPAKYLPLGTLLFPSSRADAIQRGVAHITPRRGVVSARTLVSRYRRVSGWQARRRVDHFVGDSITAPVFTSTVRGSRTIT